MITLFAIWLLWTLGSTLFGIVIGLSIREADRREQPTDEEAVADFELRRVSGWI